MISTSKHKLWFSLFDSSDYKGDPVSFFSEDDYRWAKAIEANFEAIKAELLVYLKDHELESYFNDSMVEKKHTWKTVSLKWWGIDFNENQKKFKTTSEILNSFPEIVSASFNLLQANSKIKPHNGDTNAIFRCHLGLIIPKNAADCGFTVNGVTRQWEEGKLLIFVDANYHEAFNNTNEDRYIFLFDVLRDDYRKQEKYVCGIVITGLFLQKIAEKFKFLYKSPSWLIKIVAFILYPFARFCLMLIRLLKIY